MVDRETLRMVLDQFLDGEITQQEISNWAHEMITQFEKSEDQLVVEVLYNLVSFRHPGFIAEQYQPCREKLEYFANWLEDDGECNWDQYNSIFDPCKLI